MRSSSSQFSVTTTAGQTAGQVAAAVAAAINADADLTAEGISATAIGSTVVLNGSITSASSTDPGISHAFVAGAAIPALPAAWAMLLASLLGAVALVMARRRGHAGGGA